MAWLAVQTGISPDGILELDSDMFKALRTVAMERLNRGE